MDKSNPNMSVFGWFFACNPGHFRRGVFGNDNGHLKANFVVLQRTFIRHVVFFSAADQTDVERIVEGLSRLKEIPHTLAFEVVRNSRVDALSAEVDVVVYAEFADDAALRAYKAHPIYQQAIDIVRPLRELRIAADF